MIVVKVTYTVKPDFVPQNIRNIQNFMRDFKKLKTNDFKYTAYRCKGTNTFVHLSHYKNEEIQNKLLKTPSFLEFQKQRDELGLTDQPGIETMEIVSSSFEWFT